MATSFSIAAATVMSRFEFGRLVLVGDETQATGGRRRLYWRP
jgi:hypothetical protein